MAELGSIEYTLKVNDEATPDLQKIIDSIKNVGKSVNAASAETQKGFNNIGAAITQTEQTIKDSNNSTIAGLNTLAAVMNEVKAEIQQGNKILSQNSEAVTAINNEKEAIKGAGEEAQKTTGIFANMGEALKAMGLYFGVSEIISFSKSVVETRKSVQSLRASFTTLLGDEKKAGELFEDLNSYATKTPLQVDDLAKASQTMLGFGIASEKVLPTLKQIGDISQGDSTKLQSLTLAFSQISSTGKLMGQDLLQLINAGFNPLEEMSRTTGKSMAALKDEMSKGQISAQMVADAFKSATSEGGKFFGSLEAQSKTMSGAISNFEGAMANFQDELGSIIEGPLVEAYNAGTKLLEHYKEIATALEMLVAALGAYKAAVVVANAVQKVQGVLEAAKAYKSLSKAIKATEVAQKALNMAQSLNAWGLIAAGITAAVVALAKYNSETERQQRLQNSKNDDTSKAKGYASKQAEDDIKEKTKVNIDVVFDKSGEKTLNEQAQAYQRLIKTYKQLGQTYKTLGQMQSANKDDVIKIIANADEKANVSAWTKQIADYTKQIEEAKQKQKKYDETTQGGAAIYRSYQKEIDETSKKLKLVKTDLENYNKAQVEAKKTQEENAKLEAKNKTIDELKATAGNEEAEVKARRAALEQLKKITGDKQTELEKQVKAAEKAAAKEAAAAKKAADQQRKQEEANRVSAFAEQLNNDIAACDKLIDKLKVLEDARKAAIKVGGEVGRKETEKTDSALNEILKASIKSNTDASQDTENYNDERLTEEERYTKQYTALLQERQVVELTADEETRDRQLAIYDNYLQELEKRHELYQQQQYDQTVENYGTLQQRLNAVDKSYSDSIAAASAKGDNEAVKNLNASKTDDKLSVINAYIATMPEAKAAFDDLENASTTVLEVIKAKFEDLAESTKAEPAALEGIKAKIVEVDDVLRGRLSFKDKLDKLKTAAEEYANATEELESLQSSGKATAEQLAAAITKVQKAEKNYNKTLKDVKKTAGEWGQALSDLSNSLDSIGNQMDGMAQKAIEVISSVLNVVTGICNAIEQTSSSASKAIQAVEKASVILAVISAVIQAVQALNNALSSDTTTWEEIKSSYDDYIDVLNDVIDAHKALLEELTGNESTQAYNYTIEQIKEEISTLQAAAKSTADYKKEHSGLSKVFSNYSYSNNYRKWAQDLTNAEYQSLQQSGAGKAITNVIGGSLDEFLHNGDYKHSFQYLYETIANLSGEELEDIKYNSTEFWASLSKDYQDYLQQIIDASDELDEVTEDWQASLTGVSFDELKDNFFDAISDMDTTAADFAETFTEYMRKASLKNLLFGSGENSVTNLLKEYEEMFANSLVGDEQITDSEKGALDEKIQQIWDKAQTAVDAVNKVFDAGTGTQSALSGAIATASQESIDLLAGQTNAVRINQVEAISVMREQLAALTNINATGQAGNALLESIDRHLANNSDSLRAAGIIS